MYGARLLHIIMFLGTTFEIWVVWISTALMRTQKAKFPGLDYFSTLVAIAIVAISS
jgi:hypothetical protein